MWRSPSAYALPRSCCISSWSRQMTANLDTEAIKMSTPEIDVRPQLNFLWSSQNTSFNRFRGAIIIKASICYGFSSQGRSPRVWCSAQLWLAFRPLRKLYSIELSMLSSQRKVFTPRSLRGSMEIDRLLLYNRRNAQLMSWFRAIFGHLSLEAVACDTGTIQCRDVCDCVLWAVGLENGYSGISTRLETRLVC